MIFLIIIGGAGFIFYNKRRTIKDFLREKREISVIMFTDLKDYSRKVSESEDKTLKKLWVYDDIINKRIKKYDGKVIKTIGDAIMGEFRSAINAVKCAKEIQNFMLGKKDFLLRISIHMGEVVHKKKDLFGEGVNIASRIENIAEPGSVYISEDVYRHVKGRLDYKFVDLGLKNLKNIKEAIRVYRV